MKKRRWLTALIVLIPYLSLLTSITIIYSTRNPVFEFVMENIFNGQGFFLVGTLFLYCAFATVVSMAYTVKSVIDNWDALAFTKTVLTMKLLQIPAYILNFIWGIILTITLFTIPFSIGLFFFECFALLSTGLLLSAAVINATRQGAFKVKEVLWVIVMQFVFFVDVIAAVIFYGKLKRMAEENEN